MKGKKTKSESIEDKVDADVDIYQVFGINKSASQAEITKAYRKLALKYHPDKVSHEEREEATQQFQRISEYYAILNDPNRRSIYDRTGSIEDAKSGIGLDSDMSWDEYFSIILDREAMTPEKIEEFLKAYKNSDEEREDLVNAYVESKGSMDYLLEVIMGSSIDEEERYRSILLQEVTSRKLKKYTTFFHEDKKESQRRKKDAEREAQEAEELKKELGLDKKWGQGGEEELKALIMKRSQKRDSGFLDHIAAKYGASASTSEKKEKGKKGKKSNKMPTDEEFEALQAKMFGEKRGNQETVVEEEGKGKRRRKN